MVHRIDLHIHSCYSLLDGMMSPRAIVKLARKLGYDAVAVTDHYTYDNALRGTVATARLARHHGLAAYQGLEYHVTRGPERGHVLVYFDHLDQVPERGLDLAGLLDHARDQGLTVVHPHPYGYGGIASQAFMRQADYVELNGSYRRSEVNTRLMHTARRHGMARKLVANSDAHARGQMGSAYTEVAELAASVADTLATRLAVSLSEPRRSWGKAAKMARMVLQPAGMAMNAVQRLTTRRALHGLPEPSVPAGT